MGAAPVTAQQWQAVRTMLARTCERYTALLRTVRDPNAPTTGDWRIVDTAAHTVLVCGLDLHTATFGETPFPDGEVMKLAAEASIDDVARLNTVSLQRFTERDLGGWQTGSSPLSTIFCGPLRAATAPRSDHGSAARRSASPGCSRI